MTAVADKRTEELATLSLLKRLKCTTLCKKVFRSVGVVVPHGLDTKRLTRWSL